MKILHLTLTKKWFDMIQSGEKTEEYREIKQYWETRFTKKYDAVKFVNGYGRKRPAMTVELLGIKKGLGRVEWGALRNKEVFILKLGKILS